MNYHQLYSTFNFKDKTIDNRFVVAPMTRISAEDDGRANVTMKKYYERYAKGGFSTVISEGIYPDDKNSQGYYNQPGLANGSHTESWKPVVDAVQDNGALFIAQIMHAGGQSQGNPYTNETIAPSAVAPKGEQLEFYGGEGSFPQPRAMTEEDINQTKEAFVQSCLRAKEAGFDGVELHGANGYLLDQFLTDYLNQRDDQYGGSVDNRLRLIVELIEDVREVVGNEYIVGIRISQAKVADGEHKWAGGEKEAEQIFTKLGVTSLDYIHVTDADGAQPSFGEETRTLAQAAKEFSHLPVIANGQLGDPEKAETVLNNNEADLISIGTGALANPDLPHKVKKGIKLEEFDFQNTLLPKAYVKEHELEKELTP
ncbi:NADH:flavin oxidoreductase [Halobacillus andaensis]|uniref:NADH:flavin oxidoreductase n=1 Tax=Halobacillus andaensis TaxID=1176239 RepID=A0A917EYN9_HALAA|nr:NADH:flavin oxidoreductase [Halobacillus andaensis]MBP2005848.1 2,4-dienoyl-CoA reductase-like NADH-dependent reductase (Old Yellow Enzyme family) [Halobacillus andaensis]GGF25627.1 NADH:flavin oxidoreductase [Halobacillus andaensis]